MEFEYVVIGKEGKRFKSSMKAESEAAAVGTLRKAGFIPLKIKPIKEGQTWDLVGKIFLRRKSVTIKEVTVFTRQLGAVLAAGVLLSEAIETISTDMENEYFSGVLKSVVSYIRGGESFSNALGHYPSIFSVYYLAIISSGETVGDLGTIVTNLADFMEDSERMRLKFIAAVRYPIFLICFVFCIVSGIVLFLIPKFKAIFEGAGVQLPLITRIVVGISEFSLHYFVFIIPGVAAVIFWAWHALRNFRIRFTVDYTLLQVPVIGKVLSKAFIARFCQTLSTLLKGGVGIIPALTLSSKVVGNLFLGHIIGEIRQAVIGGASLSEAMRSHADISRILVKMVAVGEKGGKLDEMLKRMGNYYEQEVDLFLNNINSILEPIFIIIIGSIVLVIALALYLPIFQMSQAVH